MKEVKFILFILYVNTIYSQLETNYWYFGRNKGLDFSSSPASPITEGKINAEEGSSTISDKYGNLLFYTDGVVVYNRNHEIMDSGFGLNGHYSTSQTLAVKKPNSENIYYIFSQRSCLTGESKLFYSTVDMKKNSGLGKVIEKNILINEFSSEKITASLHCNAIDFWLITYHPNSRNVEFKTYLVSELGVSTEPILSSYETDLFSPCPGNLRTNIKGDKLAWNDHGVTLANFDQSRGVVTNVLETGMFEPDVTPINVEFSPNGKFLYSGGRQYEIETGDIFEYDTSTKAMSRSNLLGLDGKKVI